MKRNKIKPASPSQYGRHALMLGALLALVFLAYGNALHAPLLLDNEGIILKDARIQSLSGVQLHRILDGQYWEVAPTGLYRPLVTLSYLFNYSILGNAPTRRATTGSTSCCTQ